MKNLAWKLALQPTIAVVCALIVLNAYRVSRNLSLIQKSDRRCLAAAQMQADISRIGFDLQQMETSQRGFLLTGDSAYSKPYEEAGGKLDAELAALRTTLAPRDRPLEAQFESVMQAKTAEMKETIDLRQKGYRHRAFVIVGSNHGKELMDDARALLDRLSSAQARDLDQYEQELIDAEARASRQSGYANAALLLIAIVAFFVFRRYTSGLEIAYARHDQQLRAATLQLEKSTHLFGDFRASIDETQDHASVVLNLYGGYLPRQANEKLEQIRDGARRMISTLEDLSADRGPGRPAQGTESGVVHSLSA